MADCLVSVCRSMISYARTNSRDVRHHAHCSPQWRCFQSVSALMHAAKKSPPVISAPRETIEPTINNENDDKIASETLSDAGVLGTSAAPS